MSKIVSIETSDLKQIASSNVAILQATSALADLVKRLGNPELTADADRAVQQVIESAEKINATLSTSLKGG